MKIFSLLTGAAFLMLGVFSATVRADEKIDFAKQVRPIFAESCYKCHGPEKQKGELRLDQAAAITKGGKDGPIISAGNAAKSDLYRRLILTEDDDDVMPPKGGPLAKEKAEIVRKWIAGGADFGAWKEDAAAIASSKGSNQAIAEVKLPEVPLANAGALDKLRQSGATCLPLAQNTNLLEVSFPSSADKVGDAQVALLAPVAEQVAELNLAGTKVTDAGLEPLGKMVHLRRLHLERTAVTNAGLAHLKSLKDLEYLNLYNTSVDDGGLAELASLKNLKHLYLWQSKATAAGADKLKAANPAVAIDLGWKEPPAAIGADTSKNTADDVTANPKKKKKGKQ